MTFLKRILIFITSLGVTEGDKDSMMILFFRLSLAEKAVLNLVI